MKIAKYKISTYTLVYSTRVIETGAFCKKAYLKKTETNDKQKLTENNSIIKTK